MAARRSCGEVAALAGGIVVGALAECARVLGPPSPAVSAAGAAAGAGAVAADRPFALPAAGLVPSGCLLRGVGM